MQKAILTSPIITGVSVSGSLIAVFGLTRSQAKDRYRDGNQQFKISDK